uniref:Male reproductive-related protein n=1 Tax=Ditylenchus dipsaci TaxID=166011 RepID=A0A915E9E0_9BILA
MFPSWGGMQFTHQEQQQPQFSSTNWKSQVVEGEKDVKNFFENVLPYPASHQSTEYLIESSTWLTTSTDDGGNVEVDIQQAGYQEEAGETETLENAGHLEMDIQQGEQQQAKEESETLYSQSSGGGFGSWIASEMGSLFGGGGKEVSSSSSSSGGIGAT